MQNVVVLGSTGSIGENVLDIIQRIGDLNVVGLSCNKNIGKLIEQIDKFDPSYVCVGEDSNIDGLKSKYPKIKFLKGKEGLVDIVGFEDVDVVVNALVGSVGLLPTFYAIDRFKKIALANKESLVVAGKVLKEKAKERSVEIVPIDSEHSAIYQCLEGRDISEVERIILTASGGPFVDRDNFDGITVDDALHHPNWRMGRKITIDSATLMNKGFEIIEARWLFDMSPEKIDVVIHRESIIHSAVEFIDGSIVAQLAAHDMRIPIAYALTKPRRMKLPFKINLASVGKLTFEKPDFERFPTLCFAYEALRKEGLNLGMLLNVADEIAVDYFLRRKVAFKDIFSIIELILEEFEDNLPKDIAEIESQMKLIKKEASILVQRDFIGGIR